MDLDNEDTRWKQRFQNFEKAFLLLKKTLAIEELSEVERAGLIQFFEMAFELAWKLLKDYLESLGYIIHSPREAIEQAFQTEIIQEGHLWIDALNDRNLSVHTYNEETARLLTQKISNIYYPLLESLYQKMKNIL